MTAHLIRVPYDSGHRGARMGAGPDVLGPALAASLGASDETITLPEGFRTEATAGFALARALSTRVRDARDAGRRPIVLAGNCLSSLGTASGVGGDDLAVVWLDAHGDLETPETTTSGFVDGMALAALLGRCWRSMTASVQGFRRVPGSRVVLVGARDLSDAERALIADAGVRWVRADALGALDPALDAVVADGARRVYLHVDLDVHDPAALPVNSYPAPGGLSAAEVRDVVRRVGARLEIAAAAMTAYDPSCDPRGLVVDAARALAPLLAGSA
ncbi:arginase family protein [Gemmatirosa kalamazoonensis]|nr:arginase family protein [Gemmatirosa kalamazoonensis]